MVSIINKVDLKPLNEELYARPKPPKYLIMSADTFEAVKEEAFSELPDSLKRAAGGRKFNTYMGIPIATCNTVPFGYIDIKE